MIAPVKKSVNHSKTVTAFALCFDPRLEVSDYIILVASPLNMLIRDQISNLTA